MNVKSKEFSKIMPITRLINVFNNSILMLITFVSAHCTDYIIFMCMFLLMITGVFFKIYLV